MQLETNMETEKLPAAAAQATHYQTSQWSNFRRLAEEEACSMQPFSL